jgi:hypothetical protein
MTKMIARLIAAVAMAMTPTVGMKRWPTTLIKYVSLILHYVRPTAAWVVFVRKGRMKKMMAIRAPKISVTIKQVL